MAETDANLRQVVGPGHEHASAHASVNTGHQSWPPLTNPVHPSQNLHQAVGPENGYSASSAYQKEMTMPRDATDSASAATNASAPIPGAPPPTSQDYSTYTNYPYSTNSYGYNPEYQNYYYAYQQQGNDPSHQQVGAGQTTGAPYQPLSSFQNASPYVGPTSYSGTYYNPGDYQTSAGYQTTVGYQTSGGYQSNNYMNQSNTWNTGNNGGYPPYNYSNYPAPDTNAAHGNSSVAGAPPQYQHNYNQWAGYYGQASSNALCPPGTESRFASNRPSVENSTSSTVSSYPYANSQPPPPGTTSWRQDLNPSGLPTSQGSNDTTGCNKSDAYNAFEAGNYHHHAYQQTSNSQASSNSLHSVHDNSQDKLKTFSQNPSFQLSLTNQISKKFQMPMQMVPPDARSMGKIQITTNPRIASNVAINVVKTDKESSQADAASKPAYISVSAMKSNKVFMQNSSENTNKGPLPPSFRAYVERTFARCKDDAERATNQAIMTEMINKATTDGTLFTRDWDSEPIFALSATVVNASDKKSPPRRTKSRWEPVSEDSLAEKLQAASRFPVKNAWNDFKDNAKVVTPSQANSSIIDSKVNGWHGVKFVPSQQSSLTPSTPRPFKKQRFRDSNAVDGSDVSSGSDKDESLTKYYSSAIAMANSPEERKRREHRSKRFEKSDERRSDVRHFNAKSTGIGNLYARRTNAMLLAKNFEDNNTRAVEDIDWDSLTVKGTCQEIEKRYLRLTSAPDPASVRPEEVLEKALLMVQSSEKNYLYKCDQLKSIRQDLTVQRIRNELTVKVYEAHARFALEAGDLSEYNQCQSQLKSLYGEGIKGCHLEFSAYNLLCIILHSSNNRELLSSMSRLSVEAKENDAVKHALAVRAAVTSGNYILFFRLYKKAPNLNTCLMDLFVEKMRFAAVKCMCKSYRPALPVAYVAQTLGFSKAASCSESNEDTNGLDECEDWLKSHGANIITDSSGEAQLDTKASSSQLYMPEPDDAVAHGDASLAVDDFLTRPS